MREYGHRGAEYCRNLIFKQFGVYRSVQATQRHASRISAPMLQYQTCPVCGRVARKLNRNTGICEACNFDRLWREQVEEERRIREYLARGGENNGALMAKRRYDAQRRKVARLRKKTCGDIVDMSTKLSSPWSDPEKEIRATA